MRHANRLLEEATRTLADRGESYELPLPLFENVAKRWSLTLGVDVSAAQVVLCLIELKLARLNGASKHHDSVVDIAGYAAILHEINNQEGVSHG